MSTNTSIHPRLERQRNAIGTVLELDDPPELTAVLEDIQTLLVRCGYHLRLSMADRKWNRRPKRARQVAQGSGLRSASPRRAGRPPGSANFAARQLGLGLATIWAEQTGIIPFRTWDPINDTETGRFRDFVKLVVDALPTPVSTLKSGRIPDVAYLVRNSVDLYKEAQKSGNEAERRGLLAMQTWHR